MITFVFDCFVGDRPVGIVLTGLCLYHLFLDVVAGGAATATGGFG